MFTELLLGCWSSGHRNLPMYQVSSSTMFFFVSYMHIHAPFIMYCSRLFAKKYILLNMPMFVGSQSFISLPSFMFVIAAVSELRESNQNKKKEKENSEIDYFQFKTFPGHIIFEHMYKFTLLEVLYTTN